MQMLYLIILFRDASKAQISSSIWSVASTYQETVTSNW